MVVPTISTKNLLESGGGGTSISTAPQRQPTANTTSSHYHQTHSQYQIKPSILTNVTNGDDNLDIKTEYSLSPRHFYTEKPEQQQQQNYKHDVKSITNN